MTLRDPTARRSPAVRLGQCFALAVLAMVSSAQTSVAGDGRARIERSPEFTREVNASIDRGVAWLRRHEGKGAAPGWIAPSVDSRYPGAVTALGAWTLRVCGVARDDPKIRAEVGWLRETFYELERGPKLKTYTVALMCMAVAEPDAPPIGAGPSATSDRYEPARLPARDAQWLQDMARWLERAQNPAGAWSYGPSDDDTFDHSNTQFALLGLRSAARAGARVANTTWRKALDHMLDAQAVAAPDTPPSSESPLGWGYHSRTTPYGSMTCGGIASVIICRSELAATRRLLPDIDRRADRAVRCGLAWMSAKFSIPTNPDLRRNPDNGPCDAPYYLYAIERAGVLAGTEWMGDHDWYGEGARYLLGSQHSLGSWPIGAPRDAGAVAGDDMETCMVSSCFALLFLRRGTRPLAAAATTPGSATPPPAPPPGERRP